ncbi:GspH/FimT family pseudopilin (plasmid) [Amphritea atlantica]|uniref:Type II secretion system protein H n=1 Tax=Amphritea atlantica TaxID=355243 RepID=A0ABY5H0E3_9GAMM|nr:GspH/FimT family pseudopilin [Amphritea atlantica]
MSSRKFSQGLTVIELMITLVVIGVLAAIAAPSFSGFMKKSKLTGAAEKVFSQLQYARSESIASGKDIFVSFKDTGAVGWCMGVSDLTSCDCSASLASCTINGVQARSFNSADYPEIVLSTDFTGDDTGFVAPRSVALETGTVTLTLPAYGTVEVRMNILGRMRLCSDTLNNYAGC